MADKRLGVKSFHEPEAMRGEAPRKAVRELRAHPWLSVRAPVSPLGRSPALCTAIDAARAAQASIARERPDPAPVNEVAEYLGDEARTILAVYTHVLGEGQRRDHAGA